MQAWQQPGALQLCNPLPVSPTIFNCSNLTCQLPYLIRQLACQVRCEQAEAPEFSQAAPFRAHGASQLSITTPQHKLAQPTVMQELQGIRKRLAAQIP